MTTTSSSPPHDLEAESSVLGAVMLADLWLDGLVGEIGLRPQDFYRQCHRLVFGAMLALHGDGKSIDTQTVVAKLTDSGEIEQAGGREYVETLVERIPSIANTKQYGQIVKDNAMLRNLLRASQIVQERIATRASGPDELLDEAQAIMGAIATDALAGGGPRPIGDVLGEAMISIEDAGKSGGALTGIPSGLSLLDDLTSGFQNGHLIIIAGRPSMGKSALAMTIAKVAASAGHPTLAFTMEMSGEENAKRLLAHDARLPGGALRSGQLQPSAWKRLFDSAGSLSKLPLHIDDAADQTVSAIRAKTRRLSNRLAAKGGRGVELVIVDYLQLLRSEDPRLIREQQVAQMTKGLQRMARDLNIPVIVLSQLSREVDKRTPPKPVLADLRESGAIEQDSNVVILIYREDYYSQTSERPNEADLILAKQRGGATGEVPVAFVSHYPGFEDLSLPATPHEKRGGFVSGRDDPGTEVIVF